LSFADQEGIQLDSRSKVHVATRKSEQSAAYQQSVWEREFQ